MRPVRMLPLLVLACILVLEMIAPTAQAGEDRRREFPIPTPHAGAMGIAAGPDGNLWFTEYSGNSIGRITTGGAVTEFPLPVAYSAPRDITAGPDGNLWFTESGGSIGRITTGGAFTEFPVPTAF